METRFEFKGEGAKLFVKLLVGGLLSAVTLGFYMPWFIADLLKYFTSNTSIRTGQGELACDFDGKGGEMFGLLIIGVLLTAITLGVYYPWFLVKYAAYVNQHTRATAPDGSEYRLRLTVTGGDLFVALLVGCLLSMVTLGIYTPWFICKLQRLIAEHTQLLQGETAVGTFSFSGQGADLLVTFLVGMLLSSITLGIYSFWFNVKLRKQILQATHVDVGGKSGVFDFAGTGGELFGVTLVGVLLSCLTLGIYYAWYMVNLTRFWTRHTSVNESAAGLDSVFSGAPT